jgi:hypothetical protein
MTAKLIIPLLSYKVAVIECNFVIELREIEDEVKEKNIVLKLSLQS